MRQPNMIILERTSRSNKGRR